MKHWTKLLTLLCCIIISAVVLVACNSKQTSAPAGQEGAKEVAEYVGDETCAKCHKEVAFTFSKTKHAHAFKEWSTYSQDVVNQINGLEVYDYENKQQPIKYKIDVNKVKIYGAMMDHYLVAEMPKEAGFKGSKEGGQLYRIAKLHKHEDGKYDIEPVRDDFDFNKDGKKDKGDMAAAPYTCTVCHSPGLTPTGTTKNLKNTVGCESCHGPGSVHVKSEGKAGNLKKNNETCATCHENGKPVVDAKGNIAAQTHYGTRGWFASTHSTNDKTKDCASCHTVHVSNSKGKALKAETPEELCAQCHYYKFDIEKVMWRNKTDLRDHFTRDHSFGALMYEDLGDDEKTPTIEVKNPAAIERMKKALGGKL